RRSWNDQSDEPLRLRARRRWPNWRDRQSASQQLCDGGLRRRRPRVNARGVGEGEADAVDPRSWQRTAYLTRNARSYGRADGERRHSRQSVDGDDERRQTARGSSGWSRRRVERMRSEEHTSELQSLAYLVCRLLLEKKKN